MACIGGCAPPPKKSSTTSLSFEHARKLVSKEGTSAWFIFPKVQLQHIVEQDIAVTQGLFDHPRAEFLQVYLLMHEMGHALGLRHHPDSRSLMSDGYLAHFTPVIASALLDDEERINKLPLIKSDDLEIFPSYLTLPHLMTRWEFKRLLAHDKSFSDQLSALVQPSFEDKKALSCLYDIKI